MRGYDANARICRHWCPQMVEPRVVNGSRFGGEGEVRDKDGVMLLWDVHIRTRGLRPQAFCVRGASHLRFDAAGKVVLHHDYWDAAEELYAKLPVLGGLMRYLQRMGRA